MKNTYGKWKFSLFSSLLHGVESEKNQLNNKYLEYFASDPVKLCFSNA